MLPHVCDFNVFVAQERFADIAKALGEDIDGLSPQAAAECAINGIRKLAAEIGIPAGIEVLGAKKSDILELAHNALKDVCGLTNPKKATLEEMINLFAAAY